MSEITTLLWHMELKNPNLITGGEKLLKSMNTDLINSAKILFLDNQTISVTKVKTDPVIKTVVNTEIILSDPVFNRRLCLVMSIQGQE